MTTADKGQKLLELSGYEGCELGDFWNSLVEMYEYQKDYMSEDFWLQLGLEIEVQFEDAVDWVMTGELDVEDETLVNELKDYLKEC